MMIFKVLDRLHSPQNVSELCISLLLLVIIVSSSICLGVQMANHSFVKVGEIYIDDNPFSSECVEILQTKDGYIEYLSNQYGRGNGSAMVRLSGSHLADQKEQHNCGW